MIHLEWIFLMQLVLGTLLLFLLQKTLQMKKQMEKITKEVMNYISYVTDDLAEEVSVNIPQNSIQKQKVEDVWKNEKEEAQNQLIQSVLQEYFPQDASFFIVFMG